ncbi:type 1 glutamine amidotransferase [Paraflavitalea pollutisoli]|uniref:type 1 glutamine amidotransferase n=1 Tax=Paraflavitalea pollutisoli TaxID=3034143 RepID=UPI0023EB391A|nr:amidotransferase [Paraflavitalea sp. H1-2-19X]
MRIHYIQHVPFEGLGYIEPWLKEREHTITVTRIWEQAQFPSVADVDVLIVMGGPMGVYDDHLYKWLPDEKNFIYDVVKADKKVIGICLGAQLLASVLGATIFTNKHKEIGWFPVTFDKSFSEWLGAEVPDTMDVFHWHGDKFDNPYGGVIQAASEACNHQVFTYGEHLIGLQFHLEATPDTICEMIKNGTEELVEGPFIQPGEVIAEYKAFGQPNYLMGLILEKMCTA